VFQAVRATAGSVQAAGARSERVALPWIASGSLQWRDGALKDENRAAAQPQTAGGAQQQT
jgi:hypothetical protein